nr:pancreatic lipase-related protein 2-like isoform X2 [Parasteatoda tepidariorum]
MMILLDIILLISLIAKISSYDLFEGLFQQRDPCFEVVHGDYCDTTLSEVYSPSYKGSNINNMDTQLWLFTAKNPEKGEPLHKCGGKLPEDTDFDTTVDTVVIVHGWLDGVCRTAWMREIKEQLFQREKYNVILVDWTWGNTLDYAEASANSIVVGQDIAFVVMNIMKQTKMTNGNRFHFIGHSFGSFAVSEAARFILKRKPQYKIRRMTLLDPAVAPFRHGDPGRFLDAENAQFTDVIHSNAGDCFPLGLLSYLPLCTHLQGIQYFKVSINHPQGLFIGVECKSYSDFLHGDCYRCCKKDWSKCAVMGMDAEKYFPYLYQPKMKNRTYYMNLDFECPYYEDYKFSTNHDC